MAALTGRAAILAAHEDNGRPARKSAEDHDEATLVSVEEEVFRGEGGGAIGDTVNTASRLESNAPAGTVYISRVVADALGERAQTTSLGGTIKLKGKAVLTMVKGKVVMQDGKILD